MHKTLTLAAAVVAVGALSTGALAFHDGGVAECAGCHTMHNSQDGAAVTGDGMSHAYLLKAANATDQCLSCHANYGQFRNGEGFGPGGDFYWVTKSWTWESHGTHTSTGDSHGHNVISPARGIAADATLLVAPGGDFDADFLTCTSCHDPHGNQDFRLLYGSAFGPIYPGAGRYNFDHDAPLAKGNGRRTYQEDGWETDAPHTVYKSGMGEWCSNCHTDFHTDNTSEYVHPVSVQLTAGIAANYNAYVSTDDITGGNQATSYWGLVPFEDVNADLDTVDPANYTTGPEGNDQVMCLSCHRSHASAFSDIGRWDFAETFIADSHPKTGDTGATADDIARKYYQYTFVQNQRSLCNKCHVKDAGDAPY